MMINEKNLISSPLAMFLKKYWFFIILFFALLISSFSIASASNLVLSENVTDEEGITLPKFYDNVVLHQGNKITTFMGGREVKQTKIDADYPCTLVGMYEIKCKPIESSKLIALKQKINAEDKVALLTKGIPVYDSSNYLVVTDGITNETRIEYNKSHFDVSKTNYYKIEPQTTGIVKIGFNSNVFQITNFQYGTCWNCTIDGGVVLAQNHSSINENVVGYWQFTQDANDSSQYGNNGTVQSALKSYEWYNFSSSFINVTYKDSLNLSRKNFTVSFWRKAVTSVNFSRPLGRLTFTNLDVGCWGFQELDLKQPSFDSGTMSFIVSNGTRTTALSTSSLQYPIRQWNHITGRKNGSDITIFVNGVQSATKLMPEDHQCDSDYGSLSLCFGNSGTNVSACASNSDRSTLDEIKIYNISLTNTEITSLYETGLFKHNTISNFTSGILDAGAKANWKNISGNYSGSSLEGQTNITIQVRTGNFSKPNLSDPSLMSLWSLNQTSLFNDTMMRNNGTCTNCPAPVNGTFEGESAYLFDGVNDNINTNYVHRGDNAQLTNLTVGLWIKPTGNTSKRADLFSSENWTGIASRGILMNINHGDNDRQTRFLVGNSSQAYASNIGYDLYDNKWHYIVGGYNGTHVVIYIDGAEKGVASSVLQGNMSSDRTLKIGSNGAGVSPFFNGSLAYVSFWNRSLSINEIISWSQYTGAQLLKEDGISISTTPNNRFLQYVANFYSNNTRFTPELINVTAEYDLVPRVTILSPSNISYNLSNVFLAVTSDTIVSWNYSNSTATNIAMNGNLTLNTTEGSNWIKVCGTNGTYVNCTETYFTVDSIPPFITIISPENKSYDSQRINLDITTNSDAVNMWYIQESGGIVGANTTFTNNKSIEVKKGTNKVTAYANDSLGNVNSSKVIFVSTFSTAGGGGGGGGDGGAKWFVNKTIMDIFSKDQEEMRDNIEESTIKYIGGTLLFVTLLIAGLFAVFIFTRENHSKKEEYYEEV